MSALTTRQRDLLQHLLDADGPLASATLAERMNLTPRQVSYGLKGLEHWLSRRDVQLKATPGVGVALECSPDDVAGLRRELNGGKRFQLILTPEQRQQMLALLLLDADEPFILQQLQQYMDVSRTTVLGDLDALEPWLAQHDLLLKRRPNYGIEVSGAEQARRQAMGAWAWGETPFGPSLMHLMHGENLSFTLEDDAHLSPVVQRTSAIVSRWELQRVFGQVAYAERQLGGRFSDDAVLYLALCFAIQATRVQDGSFVHVTAEDATWLKSRAVWPVAREIAKRIGWGVGKPWPDEEVASVAMHLLAATRNERWPGDLEVDEAFTELVDDWMRQIAARYEIATLEQDRTLQDGIVMHAVPAYLRWRFGLWMPSPPAATTLSPKYAFEHHLSRELAEEMEKRLGARLPEGEINNMALMLRAAYIRERPNRVREVIVVCPSGMATAQLLVARLKTRFPRLNDPSVLSLRELNVARMASADLVITTTPLPRALQEFASVIQVHPLLLPEDVEAITTWLSSH